MREPATILVFPTAYADRDRSSEFPGYATAALSRIVKAGTEIVETTSGLAVDALAARRPRLAIGIGSAARAETGFAALWRTARASGTVLVYWILDDPVAFDFAWRVVDRCSWIFSTDRAACDVYGRDTVAHLPFGASLDHHVRPPIPLPARARKVILLGDASETRRAIVATLASSLARADALILGEGWPDDLGLRVWSGCHGADRLDLYAGARLGLLVGRPDNVANRRLDLVGSSPGRDVFEAAAAGALQACLVDGLEMFDVYRPGHEILTFDGVGQFETLLDDVLARPERYDAVVAAAQARTRAEHSYDARMRTLLETLSAAGLVEGLVAA